MLYQNEYKKEMDSYVKDNRNYKAVQYDLTNGLDVISYEFCDFFVNDVEEFDGYIKMNVGTSVYNYEEKKYDEDYEYTLYAFEGDWVVFDCIHNKLFVCDNAHIGEYI